MSETDFPTEDILYPTESDSDEGSDSDNEEDNYVSFDS